MRASPRCGRSRRLLIVVGDQFAVIGHRVFERRQPALLDNPTHLLLGPMFVMAKLFIALGFRRDLALIIDSVPQHGASGARRFTPMRVTARRTQTHELVVLVTGGSGFIGQHLVSTFVAARSQGSRAGSPPSPTKAPSGSGVCRGFGAGSGSGSGSAARRRTGLSSRRSARDVDAREERFSRGQLPRHGSRAWRRRASAARRDSCTARPNPFCSAHRPAKKPVRIMPCRCADHMPGPYTRSKMLAEQRRDASRRIRFSGRDRHADHADRAARS